MKNSRLKLAVKQILALALMLFSIASLSACSYRHNATSNPPQSDAQQQPAAAVVMISLDGFRWDYIDKYQAPNLRALAANGVRAEQLLPVYPSKTFPNHISLITGLYPTHHGIVDNHFCDKQRQQCYKMGMGKDDSSWISGIPLWNLAELNGVKAATYFWPESDARINGMTPSYYYHYAKAAPYEARVQQILAWLQLPPAVRPQFVAGYFSLVDTQGHRFGPDAPETAAAVAKVDRIIGLLRDGLQQLDKPVNLIVLADHGMATIDHDQAMDYHELGINTDNFQVVNASTRLLVYAKPDTSDATIAAERERLAATAAGHYQVVDAQYLQDRHYVDSPRVADIILATDAPRYFSSKRFAEMGQATNKRNIGGTHGYSDNPDMGALFIAEGPAFKQGVTLPAFANVDVYPLVAALLHLPIKHSIDGNITPLLPALQPALRNNIVKRKNSQ